MIPFCIIIGLTILFIIGLSALIIFGLSASTLFGLSASSLFGLCASIIGLSAFAVNKSRSFIHCAAVLLLPLHGTDCTAILF